MLQQKSVLITGAGQGIGHATALAFAVQGAQVIALDRSPDGLAALKAQIPLAVTLIGDLTDPRIEGQLEAALPQGVDILVNNAGIAKSKPLHQSEDADIAALFEVNLFGMIRVSRWALRHMVGKRAGALVNIASVYGLIGAHGSAAYSASKAAVIGLTRQMATDYGPSGIRVNAVAPGLIETPLTHERIRTEAWRRQIIIEQCPLGRAGQPQEIAKAVVFLASDQASFVTGQVLSVDGGWAMGRFPREEALA